MHTKDQAERLEFSLVIDRHHQVLAPPLHVELINLRALILDIDISLDPSILLTLIVTIFPFRLPRREHMPNGCRHM